MSTPRVVELSETYHVLRQLIQPGPATDPQTVVCQRLNTHLTGMAGLPGSTHQLRPYVVATALYLVRRRDDITRLVALSPTQLFHEVFENRDFDKYLQEAHTLLEDAPVNAAGAGAIAGLVGEPPVRKRKKRKT